MGRKHVIPVLWLVSIVASVVLYFALHQNDVQQPRHWLLAHSVAVNHQVRDDDLKAPDPVSGAETLPDKAGLVNQYMLIAKEENATIAEADVASDPILNTTILSDMHVAYVYAITGTQVALLSAIHAGDATYLCAGAPTSDSEPRSYCLDGTFDVLAVHHPITQTDQAWLILSVPIAKLQVIADFATRPEHVLLIAPHK